MACLLLASFHSFDRKSINQSSISMLQTHLDQTHFSPQLLLAVGTKLEHIITDLAHEVAEKHIAVEGDLVVRPSDDLFWFKSPRLVLFLIHFILFQNSFELAFIFFIFVSTLTIMDLNQHTEEINKPLNKIPAIVTTTGSIWFWFLHHGTSQVHNPQTHHRVIIIAIITKKLLDLEMSNLWLCFFLLFRVLVQLLCSYSTLPLYALVTQVQILHLLLILLCSYIKLDRDTNSKPHLFLSGLLAKKMGSSFKGAIFNEQTQQQIVGWAKMAKKGVKKGSTQAGTSHGGNPNPLATPSTRSIQLQSLLGKGSSQQNHNLEETPEIVQED